MPCGWPTTMSTSVSIADRGQKFSFLHIFEMLFPILGGYQGQLKCKTKEKVDTPKKKNVKKNLKSPKQNFKHADATVGQESPGYRIL